MTGAPEHEQTSDRAEALLPVSLMVFTSLILIKHHHGEHQKGALKNLTKNSCISVDRGLCLLLLPYMKQRACVALSSRTFLLLDSGKLNIKSLIVINAKRG